MKSKMLSVRPKDTFQIVIFALCVFGLPPSLLSQWLDQGSFVVLSTTTDDVSIGNSAAPASKLRVYSPSTESFGEFVDFTTLRDLNSGNDALNISVGASSNLGAQFIECNRGNTNMFAVDVDGAIDLARDGSVNEVIRVRNDQVLWYDGTQLSWGFDGTWNRFARPITIGGTSMPALGDALRVDQDNITIDIGSSQFREHFQFSENGVRKAYFGYNGSNLFVENDETNGGLYLDAHDIGFNIDDVRQVTIDNNGRLGVGTSTPNELLDVEGNIALTSGNGSIRFYEGLTSKANVRWTGSDLVMDNNETIDADIFLQTTDDIIFQTAGSVTRMSIDEEGDVGIGVFPAEHKLEVAGDVQVEHTSTNTSPQVNLIEEDDNNFARLFYQNDEDLTQWWSLAGKISSTQDDVFGLYHNGQPQWVYNREANAMGIGTSSNTTFQLQVAGDVDVTGELTAASDMRLKKNIQPINDALGTIQGLHPVHYDFRTDEFPDMNLTERHKMGLIAQEVEKVLPELVVDAGMAVKSDGSKIAIKSVNYVELIPLLVQSIKELQQDLAAATSELGQKENELAKVNSRMDDIQRQLDQLRAEKISKK